MRNPVVEELLVKAVALAKLQSWNLVELHLQMAIQQCFLSRGIEPSRVDKIGKILAHIRRQNAARVS